MFVYRVSCDLFSLHSVTTEGVYYLEYKSCCAWCSLSVNVLQRNCGLCYSRSKKNRPGSITPRRITPTRIQPSPTLESPANTTWLPNPTFTAASQLSEPPSHLNDEERKLLQQERSRRMRGRHGRGGRDLRKRIELESLTELLSSPVPERQEDPRVPSPCSRRKGDHSNSPRCLRRKESPREQSISDSVQGEPDSSLHLEEVLTSTPKYNQSQVLSSSCSSPPEMSLDRVTHREQLLNLAQVYSRIILGELTLCIIN